MTTDSALALMLGLFVTCARVGGPLLLIATNARKRRSIRGACSPSGRWTAIACTTQAPMLNPPSAR